MPTITTTATQLEELITHFPELTSSNDRVSLTYFGVVVNEICSLAGATTGGIELSHEGHIFKHSDKINKNTVNETNSGAIKDVSIQVTRSSEEDIQKINAAFSALNAQIEAKPHLETITALRREHRSNHEVGYTEVNPIKEAVEALEKTPPSEWNQIHDRINAVVDAIGDFQERNSHRHTGSIRSIFAGSRTALASDLTDSKRDLEAIASTIHVNPEVNSLTL